MEPIDFLVVKTLSNKIQFVKDDITIMVDNYYCIEGRHLMAQAYSARAHLSCNGKLYLITNDNGYKTIEEWYTEDLLPKLQMLTLLESDII